MQSCLAVTVHFIYLFICGLLTMGAAVLDVLRRSVPNTVPLAIVLCGCLIAAVDRGGIASAIAGFLAAGLLYGLVWLFDGVGGADVKLMASLGFVLRWPATVELMFFTALIGAVWAAFWLIWRPRDHDTAEVDGAKKSRRRARSIPYVPAIAIGYFITLYRMYRGGP